MPATVPPALRQCSRSASQLTMTRMALAEGDEPTGISITAGSKSTQWIAAIEAARTRLGLLHDWTTERATR